MTGLKVSLFLKASAGAACLTLALAAAADSAATEPVPFDAQDSCAACGMPVAHGPGPKSEAVGADGAVRRYCSTRCMACDFLSGRQQAGDASLFVHDMGKGEWKKPLEAPFTDGRTAWYVAGSGMKGTMGATLATFAEKADAEEFVKLHGGSILRFSELTGETAGCRAAAHSHH